MNCEEVRGRFSELLENELNPLEEEKVRAHLASCPECRKDYEHLRKTMHWLRSVEEVEPPVDLVSGVYKKIEDRKTGWRNAWYAHPLRWKAPIQAAAMVCILILVIYLTKGTPPSYYQEARDVKAPQLKTDVAKLEQEKHDVETPAAPVETGRETLADRSTEKEKPSGPEQVGRPSVTPPALSSRPEPLGPKLEGESPKLGDSRAKGLRPERIEEAPRAASKPPKTIESTRRRVETREHEFGEASVEKRFEEGPAAPLDTSREEMKATKEKTGDKPFKEFALGTHDREKTISFLRQLLGRHGGKMVTTEGDRVIASLPAASLSAFADELIPFSSPETNEVLQFKEGIQAASEPPEMKPEIKKEEAGKIAIANGDTVTLQIRLFTE